MIACRTEKAPEPATVAVAARPPAPSASLPPDPPRFAWRAPLAVPVEETGNSAGRQITTRYWLDLCPARDGAIAIARRGLEIVSINGVAPPADVVKKAHDVEEPLAAMVVDHAGTFLPQDDRTAWRTGDQWQGWVELWLHIDPSRGSPQDVSAKNIADGQPVTVSYGGLSDQHRPRFEARRRLSKDEVWELTKLTMMQAAISDVDLAKNTVDAEEIVSVETDWPEVRPWSASSRKRVRYRSGGGERLYAEDRQYRFDWRSSFQQKPSCL
jgi:hypothetical protein